MNARTDRTHEEAPTHLATIALQGVARFAFGTLRATLEGFRRARRRRATIRQLSELSNDALMDIGISRSEIAAVAAAVSNSPQPSRPARLRLPTVASKGTSGLGGNDQTAFVGAA